MQVWSSSGKEATSSTPTGGGGKHLWRLLLVGLVALALRLFYLHEIESGALSDVPVGRAGAHVETARAAAGGDAVGQPSPLAPLFTGGLAVILRSAGENLLLPRLLQALFGAFACVGCGRCFRNCPVKTDITKVIETIKNEK